jgi:GT2 family glycosyltransferase
MSAVVPDNLRGPHPLVSVVIPHYGDPGHALSLIQQLDSQADSPAFEVIVSDDCSPTAFQAPQTHSVSLTVVRRERNGGFGSAVNSGVQASHGTLVLVLNSDVEIAPDFLRSLIANSAEFLPAVLSPQVLDESGQPVFVGRHWPTAWQQTLEWTTALARWRPALEEQVGHDTGALGRTQSVDWVIGVAMLMPRAIFDEVGGFDERFFMNCEEVDLQRRLRDRGYPSVVLAEPTLRHAGGGSSPDARRRGWLVESRDTYAGIWGGQAKLRTGLTAATCVNFLVNSARRLAGRKVAPITTARAEMRLIWANRRAQ